MITTKYSEGPANGLTYLDLALTPDEAEQLQVIAVEDTDWRPGRQNGIYHKLSLSGDSESVGSYPGAFPDLRKRLSLAMAKFAGVPYKDVYSGHDFYLLYFPQEGFVSAHVDEAPKGMRHIRANVAVTMAEDGGELVVPNGFYKWSWLHIKFSPGNGIIFEVSAVEHGLKRVNRGSQLWVSLGTLVKEGGNHETRHPYLR
jgi:hypothetical protein